MLRNLGILCLGGVAALVLAGGSAAQVHSGSMLMHHDPRWSPDGKWILVTVIASGGERTWLYSADGEVQKRPSDERRPERPDSVESVSRDGRTLLFTARTSEGGQVIVATNANRQAARKLTTSGWAEQPRFSPAADLIAYEARSSAHAIMESTINLISGTGSAARVIAKGTDPSWSPDGALLVFKMFDQSQQVLHIATIEADGSNLRVLAPGMHPHWSPDGRRIAYMADTNAQRTNVWIMNRDGTGRRCVTCSR